MTDPRYDTLAKRLANGLSRRAMLRGLAVGTGTLIATQTLTTTAKPAEKITLCHKPGTSAQHTLTVSANAAQAHLNHGDTIGPCAECTSGDMVCEGTGFTTCENGAWVYRACASGTACRPSGDTIICDWPTDA